MMRSKVTHDKGNVNGENSDRHRVYIQWNLRLTRPHTQNDVGNAQDIEDVDDTVTVTIAGPQLVRRRRWINLEYDISHASHIEQIDLSIAIHVSFCLLEVQPVERISKLPA